MSIKPTRARTAKSKRLQNSAIALLLVLGVTQLISNVLIYNNVAVKPVTAAADTVNQLSWNDVITFLQIKSGMSPEAVLVAGTASPTPMVAKTAAANSTIQANITGSTTVNSQINFNITYKSDSNRNDVIADLEIYDSAGAKVFQKFYDHQNLTQGATSTYQFSWTPAKADKFTLKAGIFDNAWGQTYFWENALAVINVTGAVSQAQPTSTPQSQPQQAQYVSANTGSGYSVGGDGRIYKNGQKVILSGISWFGAETDTKVPHGLWSRGYKDMISQMKSLGFNAVRLPYCPQAVQGATPSGIDSALNPDLVGLNSIQVMDKLVNEMNRQGMYFIMDNHRPDCNAQSDLWYTSSYSEEQWMNDLVMLANRYKGLEYFAGLDLKNEPKGAATWGTGNASTDWDLAVEKVGRKIMAANSNILLFVEGVENNPSCSNNTLGHWWGGNLEPVACKDIDSSAVPANKIVYTPHVYGPDTFNQAYFNTPDFPSNLPAIWDQHFGFLKSKGKALAIGEYGGKYGAGDPKDYTWQNAFIDYLSSKGICDNFYWTINPNSGDTGGILQDDWKSVNQGKVDLLTRYRNSCK